MFTIGQDERTDYTFLSLFSGAGGLDLGFEKAGFIHTQSSDILDCAVRTLHNNRPEWDVRECDVRQYTPDFRDGLDVLLAGFPCQGFSLGGKRDENDERNYLYKEVVRIASIMRPRVVVMENVLNLRTMSHPATGKPFAVQIAEEMAEIGYVTRFRFFKVSHYGVPQTRRRFIFIAYRDGTLPHYSFPKEQAETNIRSFIYELGQDDSIHLPNHEPHWGFNSHVHVETHEPCPETDEAIPVRFSRTASDGNPVRSFDTPFPAVDTATVWGWAKGNVHAVRYAKERKNALYVRNPNSNVKLWRISASDLRTFTAREYARLQTFPDDWIFYGDNKREIQLQIGNAVPVAFAKRIAESVRDALEIADGKKALAMSAMQLELF